MDKIFFSHGHLRANNMRFALVPGGHVRLRDGLLPEGSIVVDGQWRKDKASIAIHRVEGNALVKIGRDCEPLKKQAILEVVKEKLTEMPSKLAVFAAELAWRSIKARKDLH